VRSIWKGAIQFGLVTIPVKLYTATESEATVSLNMLHATDLSRIQMKVFCPVDNAIIERADTVKGYEYAPGAYAVLSEADLASVKVPSLKTIEIKQFVPKGATATRFVEKAYYLEPEPVGRKVYALLQAVLTSKDLTAIAKIAIRDRESLASIEAIDGCLLLTTLQWPDEVRPPLDLGPEPELKEAELRMGEQLVGAMTDEFDPSLYVDSYKEALVALIDAKVAGAPIPSPVAERAAPTIDLMEALQASVAIAKEAKAPKAKKAK
jgi:DNA end-binding protein Ku